MNNQKDKTQSFARLLNIMNDLREKCPWDRKQTMESLRYLTIEEVYELGEAVLEKDYKEIRKELGDLIMHMTFYAKIAEEEGRFDIGDVLNSVCDKLVERHPHVYGDLEVNSSEDVRDNWEKIKAKEGKSDRSILAGVPKSLPALVKSERIQEKAAGVGFEWDNKKGVLNKIKEEIKELERENDKGDKEKTESEFGDLMFALINYAKYMGINPENALEKTNKKFITRFEHIEEKARKTGKSIEDMELEEMEGYWKDAKGKDE
ncbi:MAG: nucleoside triphosphate pyrophosphohydrolase [Flavobacteriales bacterium]